MMKSRPLKKTHIGNPCRGGLWPTDCLISSWIVQKKYVRALRVWCVCVFEAGKEGGRSVEISYVTDSRDTEEKEGHRRSQQASGRMEMGRKTKRRAPVTPKHGFIRHNQWNWIRAIFPPPAIVYQSRSVRKRKGPRSHQRSKMSTMFLFTKSSLESKLISHTLYGCMLYPCSGQLGVHASSNLFFSLFKKQFRPVFISPPVHLTSSPSLRKSKRLS